MKKKQYRLLIQINNMRTDLQNWRKHTIKNPMFDYPKNSLYEDIYVLCWKYTLRYGNTNLVRKRIKFNEII